MNSCFVDENIQTLPMKSHVQSDGSDIGGVDPASYGSYIVPGKRPSLLMWTEGTTKAGAYPAWLLHPATARPILPNTGNLAFEFDLTIDSSTPAAANVIETDTVLVVGGFKYNLSGQRKIEGELMVGAGAAGWAVVPAVTLSALVPNQRHKIVWTYSFNETKRTCSVISYAIDGLVFPVPVALQNVAAVACSWPEGVYAQFQMGTLPAGNFWSQVIGDVKYRWW
jgi:hypothetical protein